MSEPMITVDHVSMCFNLYREKIDNIKEYVIKAVRGKLRFEEFWALDDISFTVGKGEGLGLVGRNGSGKSTMLKLLAGVMKPAKGKITVRGSVAPMIELGAGFDAELTAKENIFLNGAVLGYTHDEMEKLFNSIIDFAELQEFVDVPVKNFSTGMYGRLGFAIATSHRPDVLIVDEVLSVGDFKFQEKCQARIMELLSGGTTLLFVSHSAEQVVHLCDRAIWLDHGKMMACGDASEVCARYKAS